MIISLSGPTEVGPLPKGVGLERLRWDGERVIDLTTINPIWARYVNGVFTLHAVAVKGAQSIEMNYIDRKRLTATAGMIRLLSTAEYEAGLEAQKEETAEHLSLKAEAKALIDSLTYDKIDQHIDNVFGALSTAQKDSLKRLYKAVLFLAKTV